MQNLQRDVERMYDRKDTAVTATGAFYCIYSEEYADSLDIQGVARSISMPRHVASERDVVVGSEVVLIETLDGRRIGPFDIETQEPSSNGTVRFRLRAGVNSA